MCMCASESLDLRTSQSCPRLARELSRTSAGGTSWCRSNLNTQRRAPGSARRCSLGRYSRTERPAQCLSLLRSRRVSSTQYHPSDDCLMDESSSVPANEPQSIRACQAS
ncbi:hypothetical protein ROHU_031205 [Labeo rohita]|uniref:Uncharacterized protein n=1 Tax=Labeo rohita TaxID=84645 RepID=A0A498LWS0_LABRO|nr:hypothetical protein ROHU_031205 [Labeo rohita]